MTSDVPVPGGTAGFARALGIDPVPDRARFVAELTRLNVDLRTTNAFLAEKPVGGDLVPVPLSASVWEKAIFRRPISDATLFGAIMSDRRASWLCHGLASLDDETLEFFGGHPALLRDVYENRAGAFAAFGSSIRISRGRIVTPGGEAGTALWEAAIGQPADRPEQFTEVLLKRDGGRIAYLYDILSQLDAPKTAFALGLWIADPSVRAARFDALLAAASAAEDDWQVSTRPFVRPLNDIAMLLTRVRADATGAPVLGRRQLWARVFERMDLPADPAALLRKVEPDADAVIDAAWLTETVGRRNVRERETCAVQLGFGQRVFASADAAAQPDVLVALRAVSRFRMLMLTLERIGITDPAVFAAAARQAQRLSALAPDQAFVALAQFQGAVALVTRMARVRTIDAAAASELISTLSAVPLVDGRYGGGVARWMEATLRPALAPAPDVEGALLGGLAGRPPVVAGNGGERVLIAWEGERYRLDLAGAELRRLRRVREKQGGYPVDVASALDAAARPLTKGMVTTAEVRASLAALKALASDFAPALVQRPTRRARPLRARDQRRGRAWLIT